MVSLLCLRTDGGIDGKTEERTDVLMELYPLVGDKNAMKYGLDELFKYCYTLKATC